MTECGWMPSAFLFRKIIMPKTDPITQENRFRLAAVQAAIATDPAKIQDQLENVMRHYGGKLPGALHDGYEALRGLGDDSAVNDIVTWLKSEAERLKPLVADVIQAGVDSSGQKGAPTQGGGPAINQNATGGNKPANPGDGSNPSNPAPLNQGQPGGGTGSQSK